MAPKQAMLTNIKTLVRDLNSTTETEAEHTQGGEAGVPLVEEDLNGLIMGSGN